MKYNPHTFFTHNSVKLEVSGCHKLPWHGDWGSDTSRISGRDQLNNRLPSGP